MAVRTSSTRIPRAALAAESSNRARDVDIAEAERFHCLYRVDVAHLEQGRPGEHFFDPRPV